MGDRGVDHVLPDFGHQLRGDSQGVSNNAILHQANQQPERRANASNFPHEIIILLFFKKIKVLDSGLPWKMVLYGEEEEEMMAQSQVYSNSDTQKHFPK